MILLHVVLLLRRLNDEPNGAPWGQAVFDLFCQDMDDNLREMGVGDLAVPREMQRIGEAFYGRQGAYVTALASSNRQALVEVLKRNVLEGGEGAEALAGYVRAAVRALAARDIKELRLGNLGFPDPASLNNRTDNGAVAGKDSV
jgi:cytochrome b pre-mRNA-processing protein 3